jgi:hypothetical protein
VASPKVSFRRPLGNDIGVFIRHKTQKIIHQSHAMGFWKFNPQRSRGGAKKLRNPGQMKKSRAIGIGRISIQLM